LRSTFLAAIYGMEQRRVTTHLRVAEIEPAREIATIRPLDLDDPGAEIEQPQRTIGAGEELAHIEHRQAGQERHIILHSHILQSRQQSIAPSFLFELLFHM
jgi:hypothetical protein